jgi:hypothetical protein
MRSANLDSLSVGCRYSHLRDRVERPPDFEESLLNARALMRLAAKDSGTDKILSEVRTLLRPQSALHDLANRVMALMAAAA